MLRPSLFLLDEATVGRMVDEAIQLLEDPGVRVHSERALALLDGAGARVDHAAMVARIPGDLVGRCLSSVPRSFHLYTADGQPAVHFGHDDVHFDPGSATIEILDYGETASRTPVTEDLVKATRLADRLDAYAATSTCLVCRDVPETIADLYRLYLVLLNSRKPVVTGAFGVQTWHVMKDMLVAVAGSEQALRDKPLAVFDAAPSPPLHWSEIVVENLIDCARYGIPAEMVSMPLTGATAPVTLAGSVVQHAAESLSGIVIHQLAGPGAPIVWGGAPMAFDMRTGAALMGAIETAMIDMAYAQVGKSLKLPTHTYLGSSDSKLVDAQAGFESAAGILLGALAGINMISGAGVLEFEVTFSLEKLVIDAEIIGMTRRLLAGLDPRTETIALDVMREVGHGGNFLASPHTRRWFREELSVPGEVIDRSYRRDWALAGGQDAAAHAHHQVETLLAGWQGGHLPEAVIAELERITLSAARTAGMDALPQSAPAAP